MSFLVIEIKDIGASASFTLLCQVFKSRKFSVFKETSAKPDESKINRLTYNDLYIPETPKDPKDKIKVQEYLEWFGLMSQDCNM